MSQPIPEHNQVLLDRRFLSEVLGDFSERLFHSFGATVKLVIHGGAVMVLHKHLNCRQHTRDVDYLHRSFEVEWKQRGVANAGERMNACIEATAKQFGLGLDWMNAHADVALPMAYDSRGHLFDPIHTDAMNPNNRTLNTVYASRGLQLIGVSWSWAVALKLVRYRKDDPADIAAILKLATDMRGLKWTRQIMEEWLLNMCSPMGYSQYPNELVNMTRDKMRDAVKRANALTWPAQQPQLVQTPDRPTTAHTHAPAHSVHQDASRTLRPRTKSFSHLPSSHTVAAPPLAISSSLSSIAVPQPMRQVQPAMLLPNNPQMTMVPLMSWSQLPPGFMPFFVSPSPQQYPQQYHQPSTHQRLRISS